MFKVFVEYLARKNNQKIIKKYQAIINQINALESKISVLSDDELKNQTVILKSNIKDKNDLNKYLPEAFAVVREAAKRVLGQRHFDVQLMGGITLHNSMIAEMGTGEGKTLVSTLAAYLNALEGKGVHIVTVNDYLAQRDSQWMGQIFNFLGLSVGFIVSTSTEEERKHAYACDITYGTNNEFGFDYLRDNMKLRLEDLVQRPFNYAIIDEIDSILIDEARTPLIISGASDNVTEVYKVSNSCVKYFNLVEDFILDEKTKNINFTEEGLQKAEQLLQKANLLSGEGGLFDAHNIQLYHFLTQSLKAHHLFKKDGDYIVKDGGIVIIDEFTGRVMDGRRYSDGLHQALEAKENLKIRQENQTLASITFQNYFKMYPKLSGMTGTAMTEAQEFLEIYGLKVVSIPPNRGVSRLDYNDKIYLNNKSKEKAIVAKVKECYEKQQPVLIGTISIEKSEALSNALKKEKIPHNVLNAKQHEKEAYVISQAGTLGAVTIATNMAGRGTDIQLGGNVEMMLSNEDLSKLSEEEKLEKTKQIKNKIQEDKDKILKLGGLCVIATERHESRRIDNQLRGRSGRQGEIGESIFYVSLEDDLMRVFGSNKLDNTLKRLGFKEDESISHGMISSAIEKAQKRVEQYNFEIRKNLLKFDNVINEQRNVIYEQRKEIINNNIDIMDLINSNIEEVAHEIINQYLPNQEYSEHWNFEAARAEVARVFALHNFDIKHMSQEEGKLQSEIALEIINKAKANLDNKVKLVGEDNFIMIARGLVLQLLDNVWKKHLLELDYVRSSINLRSYANKDPFNEYQKESFLLFSNMLEEFKITLVSVVNQMEFTFDNNGASENNENAQENNDVAIFDMKKVGRNDLCPCKSGKKYKYCHGK